MVFFWTELARIPAELVPAEQGRFPGLSTPACAAVSPYGLFPRHNSVFPTAGGARGSHFLLPPAHREQQISSESSTITCSLRRVHTTPNTMTNLRVSSEAVPTECLVCSELALLIHFFPCQHSIVCEGESTLFFFKCFSSVFPHPSLPLCPVRNPALLRHRAFVLFVS